jgi:hypothetical protein
MAQTSTSGRRFGVALVILLLVGGPLLMYIWHTLSELLMGRVALVPDLVALVLLAVLVGLLKLFAGYLNGLADS